MNRILLFVALFFTGIVYANACNIAIRPENPKSSYSKNEEVVVRVSVFLNHRNCKVELRHTRFVQEGLTILSATDWVETEAGKWERRLRVRITEEEADKATISANRVCDVEGGKSSYTFKL